MDELEKVVNKMQSDAAMKCTRETDRARAYQEAVYRSAACGDIIAEKYRVERMEENIQGNKDCEKCRLLSEWDEVVDPIREYFRKAREKEMKNLPNVNI